MKVLIFAATTAYSSRLNLALVAAVELRLRCWPGGYGDTSKYEDYRMPSRFGQRALGTRAVCFFVSFVVLLGRGRRGQLESEGADSSGCRKAHKIDRTPACWCILLIL